MCLGLLVLITVSPLLSLQGGLFISNTFEEVLNKRQGSLYCLAKTMVSSAKAQVQEVGGHAAEDPTQIQTSSWCINHPGSGQLKFDSSPLISFISG